MTTDQLESILRPLAEEFTRKVAAAVRQHLRERVGAEMQAVVARAFGGALELALPSAAATATAPAAAPAAAANRCSTPGCGKSWYRPSGRDHKLCYEHFLAAGGKAPPGKAGAGKKTKKR
ncbi:MAG TPA: hypothetical protein VGQ83_38350 [Polyangia bacterium]|jgi:stage V sporulation protein SpoVS